MAVRMAARMLITVWMANLISSFFFVTIALDFLMFNQKEDVSK